MELNNLIKNHLNYECLVNENLLSVWVGGEITQ